jgi:serine/threonine protein kinase
LRNVSHVPRVERYMASFFVYILMMPILGNSLNEGELLQHEDELRSILKSIHIAGVIHGDVRPANFIKDAKGSIHVIDFGRARVLGKNENDPDLNNCYVDEKEFKKLANVDFADLDYYIAAEREKETIKRKVEDEEVNQESSKSRKLRSKPKRRFEDGEVNQGMSKSLRRLRNQPKRR